MVRGYIPSTDVMSNFLQSFDVDDGRTPCPMRRQTVTAPQALFTMNDDLIEKESSKFARPCSEGKRRGHAGRGQPGVSDALGASAIRQRNWTRR